MKPPERPGVCVKFEIARTLRYTKLSRPSLVLTSRKGAAAEPPKAAAAAAAVDDDEEDSDYDEDAAAIRATQQRARAKKAAEA